MLHGYCFKKTSPIEECFIPCIKQKHLGKRVLKGGHIVLAVLAEMHLKTYLATAEIAEFTKLCIFTYSQQSTNEPSVATDTLMSSFVEVFCFPSC